MEYVALGDLSHFIKKRDTIKHSELVGNMMEKYPNPRVGGLNETVSRHFLQQLASALQFLRAKNLIHRDVKPQNLLLNPSIVYFETKKPYPMPFSAGPDSLSPVCGIRSLPMLKIADFGFARALPPTSLAETLCGSPLYMAPEILRYEKYNAAADLWSVGTVLYEMVTSKPPFRASNHVELLRKIEKGEDKIKFPEDVIVSDQLKRLIRSLLRRDPRDRMTYEEFFAAEIVSGPIPGLVGEDIPEPVISDRERRRSSRTDPAGITRPGARKEPESPYTEHTRAASEQQLSSQPSTRRQSTTARQPSISSRSPTERASGSDRPISPNMARPSLQSHTTAPGRQELQQNNPPPASTAMARQGSGPGTRPSRLRNEVVDEEEAQARLQQQERADRAAQDIAFERDYVVVEKKAVEVNALADELNASPRLNRGAGPSSQSPQSGALVRRATQQGPPSSTTGAQTSASRAVQIASGRPLHARQNSHERRYGPSPTSATSAISKALNMASGRLFGIGFSPPVNLIRGGRSPPGGYSPFPAYPSAQNSLVVIGDSKQLPLDEDSRVVQTMEEIATKSDVVYGFAEVKWQQLTPATPSSNQAGLGLRNAGANDDVEASFTNDLTIEATVIVAEQALVLYVKALALLAKAMGLAARWWQRNNHGDGAAGTGGAKMGSRMNNVVQWIRERFNVMLEKSELVRLRLRESQKKLPEDHPSHPSNVSAATTSSTGLGTSTEAAYIGSGETAEKLMYDRALEMSRAAAISEVTGEDLPGCEISYVTAIRMLEAILEDDEESGKQKAITSGEETEKEGNDDVTPVNGLGPEEAKTIRNRKSTKHLPSLSLLISPVVKSIRNRLASLRNKMEAIRRANSASSVSSGTRASPPPSHRASTARASPTPPK
jgi:serine/threonine-protein kinase ULK2